MPKKRSAALHKAASRGDHETITTLLADGADLHARDNDGWTPLHSAAWKGHREAITALLDAHADLHARDNDGSLLSHKHHANLILICSDRSGGSD